MKAVQELLVVGVFVIVVILLSQSRLPGRPTNANIANRPGIPGEIVLLPAANMLANWEINDYLVFRVATSRILGVTMVADPITGKWHSVPQS